MCGGTSEARHGPHRPRGLSPRVRGNLNRGRGVRKNQGSIPACAGEPLQSAPAICKAAVYPRVCGGTVVEHLHPTKAGGLSPRVRGNLIVVNLGQARDRSIPACAGEPKKAIADARRVRVYPRVCGGTAALNVARSAARGLSPRVRGNPHHPLVGVELSGSIPACAGEPSPGRAEPAPLQVYPRVCGGTMSDQDQPASLGGLSPRVRGNRRGTPSTYRWTGSIPACAGEPRWTPSQGTASRVYPRVCGGTMA